MLSYYKKYVDSNGFIYSIDRVVVEYCMRRYNMDNVSKELIKIYESNRLNGWNKTNLSGCPKYSYFQNVVHFENMHLMYGKYQRYDRMSKSWSILPILRVEFNPNKWHNEFLRYLKSWIVNNCADCEIKRYDLAVDIPTDIHNLNIINSRKEEGLYKGTRYRGKHNSHMALKVYDKQIEAKLENPLTRVEYTICTDKPMQFTDEIGIANLATNDMHEDLPELNNLNQILLNMMLLLEENQISSDAFLRKMNYQRKKTLAPHLKRGLHKLEIDKSIIEKLIGDMKTLLDTDVQENNFISIMDDEELPFE